MQIVIALLFLLAAAKVHPTPEMQDLKKKMEALSDKIGEIGEKFASPDVWSDESAMNKLNAEIEKYSVQLESYELHYKALKRAEAAKEKADAAAAAADAAKAKAAVAAAAATKAAAPAASKVAATTETKTASVADKVAVTPEKILTLLAAAVADKPAAATEKSPMEKLQDEINSLKKKLDDYGNKFSNPAVYSDSTEIGKLVSKIEDAQTKMGKDYEELEKLKKAAKKAAAAKKEAEAKAAAVAQAKPATPAAPAKPATPAAPAKPVAAAKPAAPAAPAAKAASPSTSAAPYTKQPLMLVATETEPSFGLWWAVAGLGAIAFAWTFYRAASKRMNRSEIRPLLLPDQYYQAA